MFSLLATHPAFHDGSHFGGFGFLFLLIPLFWVGVIVLVATLLGRRFRRRGYGTAPWSNATSAPSRAAEGTLAERFAQGDIDEKEYRARLEVLRANRAEPAPGQ